MTIRVLFAADLDAWAEWEASLRRAFAVAGLEVDLSQDARDPTLVDYIIFAPDGPITDFSPFTNARAVLNLWAGVESIVGNTTLTQPLARMVDPGLSEGMIEWVTGHTLRHHLGLDAQITRQDGVWRPQAPPLARHRPVTILGLGELGSACARALAHLNFPVTGWSRSPKSIDGITTLHGEAGFAQALKSAQILILLLPLTSATENVLNGAALEHLSRGCVVLNPGRGALIDDDALLAALDRGAVGHATLDVFRTEPLPSDHPFWRHPKVTVTPHIASETRAETAASVIVENIHRGEAGEPFLHLVDRSLGY